MGSASGKVILYFTNSKDKWLTLCVDRGTIQYYWKRKYEVLSKARKILYVSYKT